MPDGDNAIPGWYRWLGRRPAAVMQMGFASVVVVVLLGGLFLAVNVFKESQTATLQAASDDRKFIRELFSKLEERDGRNAARFDRFADKFDRLMEFMRTWGQGMADAQKKSERDRDELKRRLDELERRKGPDEQGGREQAPMPREVREG